MVPGSRSRAELARLLLPSPIGRLGLVSRRGALSAITLHADPTRFPFDVERTFGTAGVETASPFGETIRQLNEYFAGKRLVFRLPLDLDQGTAFQQQVWRALLAIPYGATVTYKDVAAAIGRPSASRAVGAANGCNPIPIVVPCHRVVASGGGLGGYGGGVHMKERLLELERRTRSSVLPRLQRPGRSGLGKDGDQR